MIDLVTTLGALLAQIAGLVVSALRLALSLAYGPTPAAYEELLN